MTTVVLVKRIGLVGSIEEIVECRVLFKEVVLGEKSLYLGLVGVEITQHHLEVEGVCELEPSVDIASEHHVRRSRQIV